MRTQLVIIDQRRFYQFEDGALFPVLAGGVDNITLNPGTGGAVLATDDVGGVHYQVTKVGFGADGTISLVTSSSGLPTDVLDRAVRDLGKVDIASLDTLPSFDFDTGAGTVTHQAIGIAVASSGGPALIPGDTTNGLDVDVTRVSGNVTVVQPTPANLHATEVNSGSILASIQKLDNIAHAGSNVALSEHVPISGQFDDTATTSVTEDNIAPVRITSARALHVSVRDALPAGTNNIGDVDVLTLPSLPAGNNNIGDVDVASLPASSLANGNLVHLDYDTGAGTQNMPMVGLAIPASGGAIAGGTASAPLRIDPTGTTTQPVSGTVSINPIPAGNNNIGDVDVASVIPGTGATNLGKAEDAAHTSGDVGVMALAVRDNAPPSAMSNADGDYEPLHVNAEGGLWVTPTPSTSGGLSIFRSLDLDETEEEVKATPGNLYGWYIHNNASAVRYVKLYNDTAANVVVGTTTPVMTIPIPASSAANVHFTHGISFSTAITAAATTGVADNDTGAPGVGDVVVNIFYK